MSSNKNLILNYVKLIQWKISSQEMKNLKENNYKLYETKISDYVPKFKEEYPFLFKTIINGDDLQILNMYLDNMCDIESGNKTLNEVRNNLGMFLHKKYVEKSK